MIGSMWLQRRSLNATGRRWWGRKITARSAYSAGTTCSRSSTLLKISPLEMPLLAISTTASQPSSKAFS